MSGDETEPHKHFDTDVRVDQARLEGRNTGDASENAAASRPREAEGLPGEAEGLSGEGLPGEADRLIRVQTLPTPANCPRLVRSIRAEQRSYVSFRQLRTFQRVGCRQQWASFGLNAAQQARLRREPQFPYNLRRDRLP
jgi:hypothetical protein